MNKQIINESKKDNCEKYGHIIYTGGNRLECTNCDEPLTVYTKQELDTYAEARVREERSNLLGMVVKCSTGFETIGGKRIWMVDIDLLDQTLTPKDTK